VSAVGTWQTAWVAALDELELAVGDVERMLAASHAEPAAPLAAWRPPTGLGPLPASLEERARALLARQLATAQELASAVVRSRRQLRIQEAMAPVAPHPPVYVDLDG